MNKNKPYLNSSITLNNLADLCNVTSHHLSQIINDRFEKNFFDFINCYRIEEAKLNLSDPEKANLTILAISNEVGFNSKSAFNTAFKKHTNTTPSQFRSKNLVEQNV